MPAESRGEKTRILFQGALLDAITEGRKPYRTANLSDDTWRLIDAVADAHPDATPTLISDAYDSYEQDCDDLARSMAGR
ncbi:hypothetical protein MJO55_19740 [Mycolicibacterium rufum]|uniref:Uncharacterized protein n=1 Tax=Mycolicibacterium rufum TaxID=318424 RepID=A0A9X2XTQ0_9MYCO|nr:hypothetical protein [Mycolicibacterium rufum]KGI69293.1 hypothetical protein EU78_19715 [Mycolicibacterium rufum]MCV7069841.1 hypothetical protein [Mycolicibacterium rufum]ULP35484.1 hypothetical protein MJO55_19740 [Mycolicibacterium rufum]